MIGMIYNEFVKLFAKKSTFFILILALVASLAIPYMNYRSANYRYDNSWSFTDFLNEQIEYFQTYNDPEAAAGLTRYDRAYFAAGAEIYQVMLDAKVDSWEDWRYNNAYTLIEKLTELKLTDAIIYNERPDKLIEAMSEDGTLGCINADALNYYYEKDSLDKLWIHYYSLISLIDGYKESFMANDPLFVNKANLDNAVNEINALKNQIVDLNKRIEELSEYRDTEKTIASMREQIATIEKNIRNKEELLVWTQYRFDHNISLSEGEWHNRAVSMITNATVVTQGEMLSKEAWEKLGDASKSYEQYVEDFNKKLEDANNNILIYTGYLNIDTPPMEYSNDTRRYIDGVYNMITLVCIVMCVLTANIVAGEYHKGTIRLLLIRPKKRFKILSAKLFALVIIAVFLIAATAALFTFASIYLMGSEALSYPILSVENGEVVSRLIFEIVMPVFAKSLIQLPMMLSLAFFFTTVTKSAILSVAVPMILTAFSQLATLLFINAGWLKVVYYSPLTYIGLWNVINKTGNLSYYMENTVGLTVSAQYGFDLFAGIAIVFVALSYLVFDRKDVKN